MKSLRQLQSLARIAVAHQELVEVAENFSPTAAYDRALALHYSEEIARSCRFLAIIRRDHGIETFKQMLESKKQIDCENLYTEMVAPGTKALEALVGFPLRIVEPEDRGLTLTQYLEVAKPSTIGLGLELGGYKIELESRVRHRDGCYDFVNKFRVVSPSADDLVKKEYFRSCNENRSDQSKMRSTLYFFLNETLFSLHQWPHKSALLVIREDLEKRGVRMAPYFWSVFGNNELWRAVRYGLTDLIIQVGTETRQKAIADGVDSRGLAFLNFEIDDSLSKARQRNRALDTSVSLIDKLRQGDGSFGWVGYSVVPGPKAAKTFNFLLHAEYGLHDWVDLLEKKGYGGSVVVTFYNIESGMYVAETGQCDAFLLQQHGIREKDDILDKAQESMERVQTARGNSDVPKLPHFKFHPVWQHVENCSFDKFLDEHFPLK